ncbi:hypothetical protein [Streptomyces sp. CA-253872]|uniref:hypothetical protein n=1 Tax=Streptomyces sp. CA-253872 TaxID=3240067 RepID=UPI003D8F7239
MGAGGREIRVPVGAGAARWTSRSVERRVLLVVHNVTSAGRLLDVLPLFHDDLRVQILVSNTGSSPFQAGIGEVLHALGLPVLPWEQAVREPVDLALSASFGGGLDALPGRLSVLSHGVGYTKRLARPGGSGPGERAPGPGERAPGPGGRPGVHSTEPTFGLSPDWLLVDGKPYVDGLVLSHPEQRERLARVCPEALDAAVLAGDPCYDRMLAARPYRERFRRALGVRRGQRLLVLNSTWNPEGLFGSGGTDLLPTLLPRLAAELPADSYRLAAVLHPNIWYGHGPGQIRAWLDRARRSGLALIDPVRHWRQALLAADAVLGDFGAVSYYAAALGLPVLLAARGTERLDPEAPLARFVAGARRLDPEGALIRQVDDLIAGHRAPPEPAAFVTSAPGRAAALLRTHFYTLLDLPEPPWPALLEPLPLPPYEPVHRTAPLRVRTLARGRRVRVERSADVPYGAQEETHLCVYEETRDPGELDLADVIVREGLPDDPRTGGPARWTADILRAHPHCALAVYVDGAHSCTVRSRHAGLLRLTAGPGADADPAAYAGAVHAWLGGGRRVPPRGVSLRVEAGGGEHVVRVARAGDVSRETSMHRP